MSVAINPAESPIYGALFGTDAMRAVWDERAQLAHMLRFEAALARVEGRLGVIPASDAEEIERAARPEILDPAELATSVRAVGYPVVGVVKALTRAAGPAGRSVHWGATTQDVVDTALVLQMRDGLALVRADLIAAARALAALGPRGQGALRGAHDADPRVDAALREAGGR